MTVQSMGDGTVRITVRVLTEEAQRVVRACQASSDNRLEGLLGMVEETLRGDRPKRTPVDVMVQISAETLAGAGDEGGISAETARRLLCDGGIVAATVDDEGETRSIGRKARAIPPSMRRALEARDGSCRFPGCSHRRWCDGHHVKHWARGGETSLANLILLCTFHHKLVHEGGFSVRGEDGDFSFFDDRGRRVTSTTQHAVQTLPSITPPTPPDGDGAPIDYHAAVAPLFWAAPSAI